MTRRKPEQAAIRKRLVVDPDELRALAAEHLVDLRTHPEVPLTLANYTPKAQYDRAWSAHPILLDCRGLIFDPDGTVVAKPFRKFFNLGEPGCEPAALPPEAPEVSEKLDGSLGILYVGAGLEVATRGAFRSDQAAWATSFVCDRWGGADFRLNLTYLFEIIYPTNRIVVDYGDREDMVLIGLVRLEDGFELPYADVVAEAQRLGLPHVETMAAADWSLLATDGRRNFEGYVLYWPSTRQRVKVKLPDYVELHRLVTDFTTKRVWEAMRDGSLERLIVGAPDEVFGWAKTIQGQLQGEFDTLAGRVRAVADEASALPTRKEQALWILAKHKDISGPVFTALDGKDFTRSLWAMLEPTATDERFTWGVA